MENNFRKRIILVKTQVADELMRNGKLKKVEGSRNAGYFDLEEIFKCLNPLLVENNVDLDVEILKDKVIIRWLDCLSDSFKDVSVDFSSLIDLEKLSLMKNKVQSEGAKQTYIRRYALNCALNLPSGDEIDNKDWNKTPPEPKEDNKSQILYNILNCAEKGKIGTKDELLKAATFFKNFGGYTDILKVSDNVADNLLKKISDEQIARMMAIAGSKGITDEQLKTFIGKVWGKLSKKDLNNLEYRILCGYLDKKDEVKK
jgi:hypothetical protein